MPEPRFVALEPQRPHDGPGRADVRYGGEWDVPANASLRLGDVALAPEPGLIDIDYADDGAAPERNHYLRGEPPFSRTNRRRSR